MYGWGGMAVAQQQLGRTAGESLGDSDSTSTSTSTAASWLDCLIAVSLACLRTVDVRGRVRRSIVCTIQPRTALDDALLADFPFAASTTQIQPKNFNNRIRAWRDGGCSIVAVCCCCVVRSAMPSKA